MGNEYGMHKNRTYSYEEGLGVRVRNNLHSLYFHNVHGDNIKLSKNGTVAYRSEGFCKGIVFSGRPVVVREPIYIKFLEISSNWSGALRIGFTMNDPVTLKSKLPRYACPDLTAMHGNWAKAIAERLAKKDSVLFYYVDPNGDVHYGIDTEEYGVFFGGVNTSGKLWAVLDIYGNTVGVEFVDHSLMNQDSQNEICNNSSVLRYKVSKNLISSSALGNLMLNPLAFHRVHGRNVTLKKNGFVVSRKQGSHNYGYAFTERPLSIEEKVVMQILQTDMFYQGTLIYGFTSCDPSNLNPFELPENVDDLVDRPEYWVFNNNTEVFQSGDVIVYNIGIEGQVEISKNSGPVSTAFHVDPTQPLWLFVNLHGSTSEVLLIGTTENSFSCLSENFKKIVEPMKVTLPNNADQNNEQAGPSSQVPAASYTECVICCEQPVNCALYRCGHMCMCHECAMKYWKPESDVQCPICRKTIQDVIKTYR